MGFEFVSFTFGKTRMAKRSDIRARITDAQNIDLSGKSVEELARMRDWLNPGKNPRLKKFLSEVDNAPSADIAFIPIGAGLMVAGILIASLPAVAIPLWVIGVAVMASVAFLHLGECCTEEAENKAAHARAQNCVEYNYRAAVQRERDLQTTKQKLDMIENRFGNGDGLMRIVLKAVFCDANQATRETTAPEDTAISRKKPVVTR